MRELMQEERAPRDRGVPRARRLGRWWRLAAGGLLVAGLSGTPASVSEPGPTGAPFQVIASGFEGPAGVVAHSAGFVALTDTKAGVLYRLTPTAAGEWARETLFAGLDKPAGLAVEPGGHLLIAEQGAGRLVRLAKLNGVFSAVPEPVLEHLKKPRWVALKADAGTLYLSAHDVKWPKGATPHPKPKAELLLQRTSDGTVSVLADHFTRLRGLAVAEPATLYAVAKRRQGEPEHSRGTLYRMALPGGTVTPVIQDRFTKPEGVAVDALGAVFVTAKRLRAPGEADDHDEDEDDESEEGDEPEVPAAPPAHKGVLLKALFKTDGTLERLVPVASGLGRPMGLAFDAEGHLYVAERRHGRALRFAAPGPPMLDPLPAITNQATLTVRGTAAPGAQITLRGGAEPATGLADATTGAFAVDVSLTPNAEQTLRAYATSLGGDGLTSRAAEATLTHDDVPPDTQFVSGPSGTLNATTAVFTVTGADTLTPPTALRFAARLDAGPLSAFTAATTVTFTSLTPGPHTVEVVAQDEAGNVDPTPATRTFTVVTGPTITGFSPTSGAVGTAVTITGQGFDAGAANNQVKFNGTAAIITSATTTAITTTVPQNATTGPITVTTSQGTATSATPFTVTPQQDFTLGAVPAQATVLQGGQTSYVLSASGVGTFTGLVTLSVSGLPSGVTAQFTSPALTAGQNTILVLTTAAATPVGAVSFVLNGTAPLDTGAQTKTVPLVLTVQNGAGRTAVSGQMITMDGVPIPNVQLSLVGTSLQTTSDAGGNFLFVDAPAGAQQLMIDANVAVAGYPIYRADVTLPAGQTTVLLPFRIMPPPPPERFTPISNATADQPITDPRFPGVVVTLPAGVTITGWDGVVKTKVAIEKLPPDRLPAPPMEMPGEITRSFYQIFFGTPIGGVPSAPLPITGPNDLDLNPGDQAELWYYDASPMGGPAGWKLAGHGTVSADGQRIVSNPGVGITRFCGICGLWCWVGAQAVDDKALPQPDTAGDPVDLATGQFTTGKTDLVLPGRMPVTVARSYHPLDPFRQFPSFPEPLGPGWALSFDVVLEPLSDDLLRLILPGNARLDLFRQPDGAFRNTRDPFLAGAVATTLPGGKHQLRFKDGTRWQFQSLVLGVEFLVQITDRNGNQTTIQRGPGATITQVVDSVGRAMQVTYTGSRMTQILDPLGRAIRYSYNASGRLATVTDPNGGVTTHTYDAAGRILTITDARNNQYLQNFYGPSGRVLRQVLADGSEYRFRYGLSGARVTGPGCPGATCPLVDSWENFQGGYAITGGTVVQTTVVDPRGHTPTHRANNFGYASERVDAQGQKTITARDGNNRVTASTDPLGCKTSYTYDAAGNRTSVTDPNGQVTRFEYEPAFNRVTKITDALNQITTFTYDVKGNLLTTTDPLTQTTTTTYNSFGQPTSVTDPLGIVTTFAYDAQGNLITTTDPLGNPTQRVYDAVSRLTALTDPNGGVTQFAYDALNRVTQITDALNGLTQFTYDPNGNLLTVTDANNQATTYTYDSMDRLKTRTDALGRQESYQYDPAGNLTQFTDRKNQVTTFTYDTLNRRTGASFADGSTVSFVYDSVGRLRSATDSVIGRIDFAYDTLNRLIQEITAQGSITYAYDALGRRMTMTASGQQPVSYGYDAASRLVQVQQGSLAVGLGYDAAGRRTSLTYPNATNTSYSYDAASRLLNILHQGPPGVIENLSYTYDAAGNRIGLARANSTATQLPSAVQAAYDAANEQIQFNSSTPNLTYDANGNLTSQTDASGTTTYTFDARNRLIAQSGPGVSASFTYDALGRRISKTINGATTQYLYDGKNIVAEINGGAVGASYLRSLKVDEPFIRQGSTSEFYHTDALGSTLTLSDATGSVATNYSYEAFGKTTITGASSNPFQYTGRENDGTGLYYYRARYYSPQLQRFVSEDPILVPYTPLAVGLCPRTNRTIWNLPDEIRRPKQDTVLMFNSYVYVKNSPVRFADPTGLRYEPPCQNELNACLADIEKSPNLNDPEKSCLSQNFATIGLGCGPKFSFGCMNGDVRNALESCDVGAAIPMNNLPPSCINPSAGTLDECIRNRP
jgi:RHS repeat-associated protein